MHYSDRKRYEYRIDDLAPKWHQIVLPGPYGKTGMTHVEHKLRWCANQMQHTSQTLLTWPNTIITGAHSGTGDLVDSVRLDAARPASGAAAGLPANTDRLRRQRQHGNLPGLIPLVQGHHYLDLLHQ